MGLTEKVHGDYVHNRRVRVLRDHLVEMIPKGAKVLDVGCGDGLLASLILKERPDITITGIDVLVRGGTHVPVVEFDGTHIPYADNEYDVVMFVDVLHHTEDPMVLLQEAKRVAKLCVVLKDHTEDGLLAHQTLRFMDRVGNARYGVVLPYNYWPKRRWDEAFQELGLKPAEWRKDVGLYPPPASWFFGRSLHFVARLEPGKN